MIERDPLDELLRELKSPEPPPGMDHFVVETYRASFPPSKLRTQAWWRFWEMRVSVPVPVLLAAAIVIVVLFWYRSTTPPSAAAGTTGIVTSLNSTGFQPLPNGEARIITVKGAPQ